jgi:hypothetical protein
MTKRRVPTFFRFIDLTPFFINLIRSFMMIDDLIITTLIKKSYQHDTRTTKLGVLVQFIKFLCKYLSVIKELSLSQVSSSIYSI